MKISMNDVLFYALSIFLVGLVLGFLIGRVIIILVV